MSYNVSFLSLLVIRLEILFYFLLLFFQVLLFFLNRFPFKIHSSFFEVGVLFIFTGYLIFLNIFSGLQEKIQKNPTKNIRFNQVMIFLSSTLIFSGFSFFWSQNYIKFFLVLFPIAIRLLAYYRLEGIFSASFRRLVAVETFTPKMFFREKAILSFLLYFNIVLNCFLYEISVVSL